MPVATSCKKEVGRITLLKSFRLQTFFGFGSSPSRSASSAALLSSSATSSSACRLQPVLLQSFPGRPYPLCWQTEIQDWHVHRLLDALPLLSDATLLLTEVSVNVFVAERLCDTAGSLQRSNKSDTTHASPLAEVHAGTQARKRIAAS